MLRELAWMEIEMEPAADPNEKQLMDDDDFEREVEIAGRGDWAELGLDPPETWQAASIEDLRDGG